MIDEMVRDLRERGAFLLEAGRGEASAGGARDFTPAPMTTIAGALDAAERVARLTPRMMEEVVERVESRDLRERTSRPVGAELSRAPSAYAVADGEEWFPRYWLRPAEVESSAPEPLRWLAYVLEQVDASVAEMQRRYDEQCDEVRAARGELASRWSHEELERLDSGARDLARARDRLARARAALDVHAGARVHPRERLPRPFPQGPHWRMLRRLLRFWLDPSIAFAQHLERTLRDPVAVADVPYLYERWCALQLLDALTARGWHPVATQQALWAIFLGGRIEMAHVDHAPIEMWIEPRIGAHGHQCGLATIVDHELSPDIVLNVPNGHSIESYVLDPTLGLAPAHLEEKGRYATALKRVEHRIIAGVRVIKHPRRSWAIAPLHDSSCRLFGFRETVGVIPLRPGASSLDPLLAFLDDLLPVSAGAST